MPDAGPVPDHTRVTELAARLPRLSASQFVAIETIIGQFERPHDFKRNEASDLVSECVLREFGDTLRIHHCFSAEAFTKDKFEYALEKVCNFCEIPAERAPRGNAGHDITIRGVPVSLKTQADSGIKVNRVHISKFMEMGQGQWGDKVEDLIGLRARFFDHMRNYERILTLRRLREPGFHVYELVEVPKALVLEAKDGEFEMMFKSRQFPKPGYCTVKDAKGGIKFQLYFDGGTERKLQIKHIDKGLCTVHATWQFEAEGRSEERILDPGALDSL